LDTDTRIWGASLTTGWESRHIHYGVNETGNGGAYTNEVGVWINDFTLSVWNGFGTSNDFEEWDFTAGYNFDLGPVFFIPGYNFRYTPGIVEEGHAHALCAQQQSGVKAERRCVGVHQITFARIKSLVLIAPHKEP
jgi:hypothetical protein